MPWPGPQVRNQGAGAEERMPHCVDHALLEDGTPFVVRGLRRLTSMPAESHGVPAPSVLYSHTHTHTHIELGGAATYYYTAVVEECRPPRRHAGRYDAFTCRDKDEDFDAFTMDGQCFAMPLLILVCLASPCSRQCACIDRVEAC